MEVANRFTVVGSLLSFAAVSMPLAWGGPSRTQQPAAIVEEVGSATADVQTFQYLRPGEVVHLGRSGTLVLGYLKSCLRETVRGGRVEIGELQSKIKEGSVKREKVECDGGRSLLSAEQKARGGVVVFRRPEDSQKKLQVRPLRIYSTSPVFTFTHPVGTVEITRLDQPDVTIVLHVKGRALDLAQLGKRLAPGARYEAQAGNKAQVFEVDLSESSRNDRLIGRLIRF